MVKKRFIIGLFLLIGLVLGLSTGDFNDVHAGDPGFDFTYTVNYDGGTPGQRVISGVTYGEKISIDSGSLSQEGYEFLGFIVKGKVMQGAQQSLRVTEDTTATAHFKPENSTAVIFMDANQDFIEVRYTNASDKLDYGEGNELPDYLSYPKPGLTATGWTSNGLDTIEFSTDTFTEDTIVFPIYQNTGTEQYILSVENGTGAGTYGFNETVTVTATGSGTFDYWLKDGEIASLDESYSFTMSDNHSLQAVYDTGFTPDSDIFVSADLFEIDGKATILGQFDLPEGEELVEWGILLSDMPGGITFDTPDVQVRYSNKYNPNTNEFVLVFDDTVANFPNYRAFAITADELDNITTTYSYVHKEGFANELIISEYGESGSYKYLEIFNGTSSNIDLSEFSLRLYANGATSPNNTDNLSGILQSKEALAITSSAVLNFNGNDAIELVKGSTVIDELGTVGDSSYYGEDVTLQRKQSVVGPNTIYTTSEWNEYPFDDFDLGVHQMQYPLMPVESSELPSTLSISGDSTVYIGETIQLTETYNAGLEGAIWISTDESIATVDQVSGVVTGEAIGQVDIYAYSYFNHEVVGFITIDVPGARTYDITFEENGGSSVTDQTKEGGELAEEPTDPTLTDNLFDGWYTSADGGITLSSEPYDFNTPVSENITLYAKWIDLTAAMDIDTFWDTNPTNATSTILTGVVAAITDKGYLLQDPISAEMIAINDSTNTPVIGDKVYIEGTYNINYDMGIVDITMYRLVNSGNSVNFDVTNAVLIDFNNYNQTDYIGKLVRVEQPFIDLTGTGSTSYARVAGNDTGLTSEIYDSKYIGLQNGANENNITGTLSDVFPTDGIQYTGKIIYIFFYDSTSGYQKAVIIDDSHIVDATTYTVSFDEDGGSTIDDQIIIDGNLASQPNDPSKTGFEFAGWYSNSALTNVFDFTTTQITANTTIYAKWNSVQTWTVNFVEDDDNETQDIVDKTINDGETVSEPTETLTKAGFAFDGWYTSIDGGTTLSENPYDFNTPITSDLTLYANWVDEAVVETTNVETFANSNATSSYSDGSFTGVDGITWTYVESRDANGDDNSSGISLPALMLRRTSDDSKITSSTISGGISSIEVKLYKGFTGGGNRQVELFINGVSMGTSTAFDDYNEHIFVVENLDITGDFTIEIRNITSKQVIIDDIKWTTNSGSGGETTTHTVSYESNEGSIVDDEIVNDGELATEPSDPTKSGFTFDGWYTDASLTTSFDFTTDPITADITLYAKWTEDGGTGEPTTTTTTITYTDTSMTSSYGDGSFTYEGIEYQYNHAGSYDGGTSIQMNGSWFKNNTAIGNIQEIIITFNSSASSNSIDVYAGQSTDGVEINDGASGLVRTYDFTTGDYDFFYIDAPSYVRIESIEITYSPE